MSGDLSKEELARLAKLTRLQVEAAEADLAAAQAKAQAARLRVQAMELEARAQEARNLEVMEQAAEAAPVTQAPATQAPATHAPTTQAPVLASQAFHVADAHPDAAANGQREIDAPSHASEAISGTAQDSTHVIENVPDLSEEESQEDEEQIDEVEQESAQTELRLSAGMLPRPRVKGAPQKAAGVNGAPQQAALRNQPKNLNPPKRLVPGKRWQPNPPPNFKGGPAPGKAGWVVPPIDGPQDPVAAADDMQVGGAADASGMSDPAATSPATANRRRWLPWGRKNAAALDGTSAAAPSTSERITDAKDSTPKLTANRLRRVTAFSTSLVVHLALIVGLGVWFLPQVIKPKLDDLVATMSETAPELVNEMLDENLTPSQTLSLVTSGGMASTSSVSTNGESGGVIGGDSPVAMSQEVVDAMEGDAVKVDVGDTFSMPAGVFPKDMPQGMIGDPLVAVDNYEQAMDRITQEILNMLAKGKVLVVWCFDQSESMKDDHQEIRDRIKKVYEELGLHESADGDALLTAVTSFGSTVMPITKRPTYDIDRIREAIDSIPIDKSGQEMMCQAVGASIEYYRQASARRQMALILVTDESGDETTNITQLESAIQIAKEARCPIYTLGREAVFGYPWAYTWWRVTVPAVGGGTVSRDYLVKVDRGPETPDVEQLQTDGLLYRRDAHPSGCGAYEQTRLATQTGGMFFMLPSPEISLFQRIDKKYDPDRIRPYLPDLRARDIYLQERSQNVLRATMRQVIGDLNPYDPDRGKFINMRHTFSIDPATFVQEVVAENKKAEQYFLYLHAVEKTLEGMQKLRGKEVNPRWQANYDLMFAQVIAYKVRLYEYGAYLAEFIKQPKKVDPGDANNVLAYWEIVYREETLTDKGNKNYEDTRNYKAKSRALFEEVIRYHDGTPWAARAEFELQRGFGVELQPRYTNPNAIQPVPLMPFVEPKL